MRALLVRRLFEAIALVTLLAAQAPTAGAATERGLRAVYETTRSEENPAAEGGPKSEVERKTLTARLTPTMLALRDDDVERIFDFGARRIVVLDHAARSAYEMSLYAEPGFRERELVNRSAMSKGFAAILGQKYDLVEAESELGMKADPPARLKLREEGSGDERRFSLNKRDVVTFVPAVVEVPAELSRAVERLYLFEAQLHPEVRKALMQRAALPSRLTYGFKLFDSETVVSWQLREAVPEDMDLQAAAAVYPLGPMQAKPLLEAAWRVRSGQAGAAPKRADYEARAERLLAEGRAFESFLVGMECAFATGEMPEHLLRRARDAAAADPRMQAYSTAGAIEAGHGDPGEALRLLEPIDAANLEGAPAIHVQRANQHLRMRNGDKALEEFARALAVNPFMVGPWHDAGWLYWGGYGMPLAWACWDAARTIAPGYSGMKDVAEMEGALGRKYPEFF
jgi:hypothetical protein